MQMYVFFIVLYYVCINKQLPPPPCSILPFIPFQQLPVSLLLSIHLRVLCSFAFTLLPYFAFSLFSLFYICSVSFFNLQDTAIFVTRCLYLPPPSRTSSPPLIPRHLSMPSSPHRSASYCFLFFSALRAASFFPFLLPSLFPHQSVPLFVSLPPVLTLPLAECSVGNRHLGRRISISPLACWDRFSKNTAKGYLTTYACGSAGVHKHTLFLSIYHSACVFVCMEVNIPGMQACQIWSYPLSAISPRIATLDSLLSGRIMTSPQPRSTTVCVFAYASVCACVSIYNLKGFRVGLVAGKRADQGTVRVCVCVSCYTCTHVWWAYRTSHRTAICNPDYAAFH